MAWQAHRKVADAHRLEGIQKLLQIEGRTLEANSVERIIST